MMRTTAIRTAVAALTLSLVGASGIAMEVRRQAGAPTAGKGARMADHQKIMTCEARQATINLMGEAVLTRAAVTPETIARHAPAVTIGEGDPRLARLTQALRGVALEPATQPSFDVRMLLKVDCRDGGSHVIAGSATDPDGRMQVSIDGHAASTTTRLRATLDQLAG